MRVGKNYHLKLAEIKRGNDWSMSDTGKQQGGESVILIQEWLREKANMNRGKNTTEQKSKSELKDITQILLWF